jgi:ABC-type multidrug transport system ATPase subunit
MADAAIRLTDVTKRYRTTVALDHLTVSFPEGRLTGFLGPNAAGKTTTFRSCLGLTRPQEGTIDVLGLRVGPDTHRIVQRVGAIVEEPGLHRSLSAVDNLRIAAHTMGGGHGRIDELLEFVGLSDVAHRKVDGYSKGMRQRLALGIALLGDPELLLLDEPLDGLDPAGQASFKRRLRSLVEDGHKTVVVSSHDLADIEELADHVVVIDRGRVIQTGSVDEVVGGTDGFRVEVADLDRAIELLRAAGYDPRRETNGLLVQADDGSDITRVLAAGECFPAALIPRRESLEQVFLRLTGGEE